MGVKYYLLLIKLNWKKIPRKKKQIIRRWRKTKRQTNPSSEESDLEIDNEGVIEPDTDAPQEMGDENVEVKSMACFLFAVRTVKAYLLQLSYDVFLLGKGHVKSYSDLRHLGKHLLLKIFGKTPCIFYHTLTKCLFSVNLFQFHIWLNCS